MFLCATTIIGVWIFGFSVTPSVDTLKTLMDLNATLLGFFGLLAIFIYTSYDTRINALENTIKRYKIELKYADGKRKDKFAELIKKFNPELKRLGGKRNRISLMIIIASFFLLLSLILLLMLPSVMYVDSSVQTRFYFESASLTEKILFSAILSCLSIGILTIFGFILTISRKYRRYRKPLTKMCVQKLKSQYKTKSATHSDNH